MIPVLHCARKQKRPAVNAQPGYGYGYYDDDWDDMYDRDWDDRYDYDRDFDDMFGWDD